MEKSANSAEQSENSQGNVLLSWEAPEYDYREKSRLWKLAALLVVIGLALYAIVTASYPFAVVVLLFAVVYFLVHKEPRRIDIRLTDMGIQVGHRFFEYAHIRHFWILFKPGEVKNLNLRLTKEVVKEMTVLLGNQDPAEVRAVLARFIPELTEKDESFIDWLIRKLHL